MIEFYPDIDPQFAKLFRLAQSAEEECQRRNALRELARAWHGRKEVLPLLLRAGRDDPFHGVRLDALEYLAKYRPELPEVQQLVIERARMDPAEHVRLAAMRWLTETQASASSTLELLCALAVADASPRVRWSAVRHLGIDWRHHPEVKPLLFDRARNDSASLVREEAVKALAEDWREDPETLSLLLQHAVNDPCSGIREAAAAALTQYWPDNHRAQAVLWNLAVSDPDFFVHRVTWPVFIDSVRQRPDVLEWLQRLASAGPACVRASAIAALAELGKGDGRSMQVTLEAARTDQEWTNRKVALQALVEAWPDAPETRALLMERVQFGTHSNVRRAALELLARHRPLDLEAHRLIRRCGQADPDGVVRQIALRLLIQIGEPDDVLKAFCLDRARLDDFWPVRRDALDSLARHWPDSPAARELITECITRDESCYVRRAALQAFSELSSVNEERLRLLHDRALNDTDGRMRRKAALELIRLRPRDIATRDCLLALARRKETHADSYLVWPVARRGLLKHWRDDREVKRLFPEACGRKT